MKGGTRSIIKSRLNLLEFSIEAVRSICASLLGCCAGSLAAAALLRNCQSRDSAIVANSQICDGCMRGTLWTTRRSIYYVWVGKVSKLGTIIYPWILLVMHKGKNCANIGYIFVSWNIKAWITCPKKRTTKIWEIKDCILLLQPAVLRIPILHSQLWTDIKHVSASCDKIMWASERWCSQVCRMALVRQYAGVGLVRQITIDKTDTLTSKSGA